MLRIFLPNDDLAWINSAMGIHPLCNIYNPETHDLVPKKSFQEKLLNEKKEQLKSLKESEDKLKEEIKDLEKRLTG